MFVDSILEAYKNLLPYEITLHRPGGGIISELTMAVKDRSYSPQLGGADTFSFTVFEKINGTNIIGYDSIRGKNLIRIKYQDKDLGFFEIQETVENVEGKKRFKTVTCLSAEIKLSMRRMYLTEGVFTLNNLLDEIIGKAPSWTVGHVDLNIGERSRYIDVVDQNLYEFMLGTIQQSFECVFEFDTVNKVIDVYSIVDYGEDSGIYLSYANLIKALNLTDLSNEVVTRLYLYGDKEESVRDINFGQDYIENYSFFKTLEWMSQGLIDALDAYDILLGSQSATYSSYLADRISKTNQLTALQTSLQEKEGELTALLSQEGILIATSQSTSSVRALINAKNIEITSLKAQIVVKTNEINAVVTLINNLIASLSKSNHFTEAQLEELDQFVYEQMFQDSTYSLSTYYDYDEKITMQTELLAAGEEMLSQLSFPRLRANLTIADFLQVKEFSFWRDKFKIGDRLYVDINGIPVTLRITGYTHDWDSNSLSIVIGDKYSLDDATFQMLDLLQQSINMASTVSFERFKYTDYVKNSKNEILGFLNNAFDITQKSIVSGADQDKMWDESGLLFRRKVGSSFAPEQIKITNNAIALTKDGFNTVSTAIGQMPNGQYGIAAELLLGKVILGSYLEIEAGSAFMTMNENGITTKDTSQLRQILINPADGFKIQTRPNTGVAYSDKFTVDLVGNITYTGELRGTDTQDLNFSKGHISGSSININNKFTVDKLGNLTSTTMNGAFDTVYSTITQTESTIALRITNEVSGINSTLTVMDGVIASKVGTIDFNSTVTQLNNSISSKVATTTFNSTITQLNNDISFKVSNNLTGAEAIISLLNSNTGTSIKLEADRIELNGITQVNRTLQLGKDGAVGRLFSAVSVGYMYCGGYDYLGPDWLIGFTNTLGTAPAPYSSQAYLYIDSAGAIWHKGVKIITHDSQINAVAKFA